jgi:hypothetical protein
MALRTNVAVTGGAVQHFIPHSLLPNPDSSQPFLPGKHFNTSAIVRNTLSSVIQLPNYRRINIIKYPHDIPASWSKVRALIPQLLSNKRQVYEPECEDADAELQIDILVQMGMRRSADCIVFETVARRDSDVQRDIDDELLPAGDIEPGEIWEGLLEKLATSLDVDAGSFLCEFQFYCALAKLYKREQPAKVVFVHTPPGTAEKDIEDCAMVVEACIKALMEQSGL